MPLKETAGGGGKRESPHLKGGASINRPCCHFCKRGNITGADHFREESFLHGWFWSTRMGEGVDLLKKGEGHTLSRNPEMGDHR